MRSDIKRDRKSVTGSDRGFARIGCYIQLSARDLCSRNGCRVVAEPQHDARNGIALNIEILKIPRCNTALTIENERAWKGDTHHFGPRVSHGHVLLDFCFHRRVILVWSDSPFGNRIQNSVSFDGSRAGIRQQRKRNPALFRESSKNLRPIVADRRQSQSLFTKLIYPALQLHELCFAVRSPICRSEEDQHGALGSHYGLQCPSLAVLIRETEVWSPFANLRAELRYVNPLSWRLRREDGFRQRRSEQQRQTDMCVRDKLHQV